MKKQSKIALLIALFVGNFTPQLLYAQASTEGSDFWVTFLQADQDSNNPLTLELTITSRENCDVTIENPFTNYSQTVQVTAGQSKTITLYNGDVRATQARNAMNSTGIVCYAVNSEQADNCALHVTAKNDAGKPVKISLFASNYKRATFDATNVLPTTSLLDEYIVQTYTPSDHSPVSNNAPALGSHFAIIAAEDNVVVDYWPTVATTGHAANTMVTTPTLNKGQVWYVWTGKKEGEAGDLSGTRVMAREGKKIAVFQGCPHTNIPYHFRQRDHLFSQAMPTDYWGSRFVLTASKERKKDIIRVLALYDNTRVFINGELVYTFNFTNNDPKQYWEFVIGENGDYAESGSCYLTTSCPCAVHLFMASQEFDNVSNGDPAMLWVNPIEQRIDQITFATYNSQNGTTQHYANIVTDKPNLMTLDGISIASEFKKVNGAPEYADYSYAQLSLGTNAISHTLKSEGSSFIAHVYGFTSNESYGYSAGSATIGRQISVSNVSFESGENAKDYADAPTFCEGDSLLFDLRDASGSIYRIVLDFGDGTSKDTAKVSSVASTGEPEPFLVSIKHAYSPGWYDASATVYGEEFCTQPAFEETIPIIFKVLPSTTKDETVVLCADELSEYRFDKALEPKEYINPDPTTDQVITDVVEGENCTTYNLAIHVFADIPKTITVKAQDFYVIPPDYIDYFEDETVTEPGIIPRKYKREGTECVSPLYYDVDITKCLDFKMENDLANPYSTCQNEEIKIPYSYSNGGAYDVSSAYFEYISGEETLKIPVTLQDESELDAATKRKVGYATIPVNKWPVGQYRGTVYVTDANCTNTDGSQRVETSEMLDITVNYPSDIFKLKFGTTLAVYKSGYGGNVIPGKKTGYTFTSYQWYHDGVAIPGATNANYYSEEVDADGNPQPLDGEYYVELTGTNGTTFKSCPQYFKEGEEAEAPIEDTTLQPYPAPAKKVLLNRQILILHDGNIYNIYGQKVE